ncbi:LIM and calponin homology domains-containing protein 1-like isoform X1 [Astyanax mexicanus]|uniref:LIM and calponin homology domains-containing protein 1-like isoform X1 n=1 Tax=Astyanax mexicanus TaxID=7994 RepID=A0A8T2LRA6_ASTMX|nr:LIM and calponin homology domains-containing protein 1-like isoform X1 [Astyanax mexicanus]
MEQYGFTVRVTSPVLLTLKAVTGRNFGEKDFRGGLDNGILLCELLSSIKPGLVKKINRLPTPVAGLTLRNIVFDVPRHSWSPEC